MGLGMSESLGIDSPFRRRAMPKSYSADLRERVIEAVEMGASRHEAADRFEVSVSSAVKWLQRWHESGSAVPKPRGGSVSGGIWRRRYRSWPEACDRPGASWREPFRL